jgi:hypothetical protein
MQYKFFPLYVVKKFNLQNDYLDKLADSEILEFMYNELEKEKYKDIQQTETAIELTGDHTGFFFNRKPIRFGTQAIDFGTISIKHGNHGRKIVFKYQSTIYPLINLITGVVASVFFRDLQLGIITFLATLVLFWVWVFILQIMTISGCIDRLEYTEHWKGK